MAGEVERAIAALREGRPVLLPTDTVYGLAANPEREDWAKAALELKGRDGTKPTALLAASVEALLERVPELWPSEPVLRALLPGPYTLVLPNPARRYAWLAAARPDSIGVRVPELARARRTGRRGGRCGARDERQRAGEARPGDARRRAGPHPRGLLRRGRRGPPAGNAVDGGGFDRRRAAGPARGSRSLERHPGSGARGARPVASRSVALAQETFETLRTSGLADIDPETAALLGREADRQRGQIELIASENFTWPSVLEAVGSVPTNKYAEGYPGKRYYGGCEVVDEIEELARTRAKELFGAEHANVQPHAGAQANMAVYFAVLSPGDPVLGLSLDHGGHLTHGLKVNFSGKLYEFHHYGVSRETMTVDYDDVLARAKEVRPKLIVCGGSAYPRTVEADRFRAIADEVGALLLCDMAHFSGLVAAGLHPSPVPHSHFVTSTTHKTLAGPRAGFVLCTEEYAQKVDRANFPGMQGGPLMHTIAAKATCFKIAATEAFHDYQRQIRVNADTLASGLLEGGLDVLTGGTDTHLVQLDLRATEWTGLAAQERLEECKLTANRNTVPFDERPPMVASGVRLGTPAATMRGFDEDDFAEVASIIVDALQDDADVAAVRSRAETLCEKRPLYPGFRGYTSYA